MCLPLALLAAAALQASPPPSPPSARVSLEQEVTAWHEGRKRRLAAEDGWLSLIGLHWLDPGTTTVGSDPKSQLDLPAPVPPQLGTFAREGRTVSFQPAPGVTVTRNGAPFTGGALTSDAKGEPDVLQLGSVRLLIIERGEKIGVRVKDAQAPARKAFTDIARFPVDVKWRVEARLVPASEPRSVPVPTVIGTIEQMPSPGQLVFELDGKRCELTPVAEDDKSLFVIFGDETNKAQTYGAGRFLYTDLPDKEGKVTLDFNRAYNPPCAFSKFATCPLPPKGNRLKLAVTAGEKRYSDH